MRLLGVIRLSKETDESTSPERQRAKIEAYASAKDHKIIGWAVDLDVSGKVPPADRPELGPWLKQRAGEWDGLIAAKPDRISRSLRDFLNLWHDLDKQGKTLISLDPELDFSTPIGRLVANVLMSFAQFEREMISDRVKDAYVHIRANSGYAGGPVPFGYLPVKRDGKGWEYQQDPEYAPVVREMVDRVLAGQSMRQVAIWLNETGVPTSRNVLRRRQGKPGDGSTWSTQTVKGVLTSPAIAGMHAAEGKPLRNGDGLIVQRCEGIIDRQEWEQVKQTVSGLEHRAHRVDANPLLQVAFCAECKSPLYTTSTTSKGKLYTYYRCSKQAKDGKCESRSLPAAWLEEQAGVIFLAQVGDQEAGSWVVEPAEDHERELADVEEAISELDAEYKAKRLHAGAYARMVTALEERREVLKALPSRPETPRWVGTGETYKKRWETLPEADRGKEMRSAGFRLYVSKTVKGVTAGFQVREYDMRSVRLQQGNPRNTATSTL